MSVRVIVNDETIYRFIRDKRAYLCWARARFDELDIDKDGVLSYREMLPELECHRVFETRFGFAPKTTLEETESVDTQLFKEFDRNSDGVVDFQEFKSETRRLMMDKADEIGRFPHELEVDIGSFLDKAAQLESINGFSDWWFIYWNLNG